MLNVSSDLVITPAPSSGTDGLITTMMMILNHYAPSGSTPHRTLEDSVISRAHIAQVLLIALSNEAEKNKTVEPVAVRGDAQQDVAPLFLDLRTDNHLKMMEF